MPTQPLGPIKILYIENDANNRRLVQRVLESEGYSVTLAEDGLTGLELARKIRPTLVLTDIGVGWMSGYEVATRMKEQPETRHTPVIAVTSATLATDRERALAAGCDGFISKPIDIDALPLLVRKFLSGAREHMTDDVKLQRLEEYSHALVTRLEATVAELRKANAELRHLDKLKKDIVVLAGHELRTPATLIYGYTNWLKMESQQLPQGAEVNDVLDRVIVATGRLTEVVDTVINVTLIDSEQAELTMKPVDLSALIQSIGHELQPILQPRNLKFETGDLNSLPPLPADSAYLRRALTNLLDNSIKYTPDGGTIRLDANLAADAIHLVVAHVGVGIDPQHDEGVLSKFYLLEETSFESTSRNVFLHSGLGLGLAVVYGIVLAHGGRIWIESQSQETAYSPGNRLHILLPLTPPARRAATNSH
ncbi:MAG: hybrid sensor histidine kinase/response regulator [Anaerolineae bacterium]